MRRLSCILLTMALSACIGVRIPIRGPGNVQVGIFLGPVALATIRIGLTRLRDDIPARRAQLHAERCGSEKCYSAAEVEAALAKIRKEIQVTFPDAALASRLSLDEEIRLASEDLGAPETTAALQLVRYPRTSTSSTYRESVVDAVFERIRKSINSYLAHNVLNPKLRIRSEPARATFEMQIATNDSTNRKILTNGELPSVWRGRYSGYVRKKGYRDSQAFTIDLINDSGTTVRCTLVRDSAPESEESNCWLDD